MSKYRVYELAKEYNTASKVIIDILSRNNIVAKNHMSSVDEDAKAAVERAFARKSGAAEGKPEKAPSAPMAPAMRQGERSSQPAANTPGSTVRPAPYGAAPAAQRGETPRPAAAANVRPNQNNRPGMSSPSSQPAQRPAQTSNPQRPAQTNPQRSPQGGGQYGQSGQRPAYQNGQRPPQNHQPRPGYSNNSNMAPHRPQQGQQGQAPSRPGQQTSGRPGGQHSAYPASGPRQGAQGQQPYRGPSGPKPGGGYSAPHGPNTGARPAASAANASASGQRFAGKGNAANRGRNTNDFGKRNNGSNRERNGNRPQNGRGRSANNRHTNNAPAVKPEPPRVKSIKLGGPIAVNELASKLGRESGEVIKKLMLLGTMATINQQIDFDTATIVAGEFGVTVEELPPEEDPTEIPEIEDSPESLVARPPVVTVMGHVDHGKTSLLDAIRQTHVTAHEAGGITQHIGAYQVNYQGKKIVFLDTPGHEAFTAMRARGAQVTDIAILVVAADDGVMPQTIEAINHAKSAKVPIIVAVNKIDRPNANPDRVKQQLAEHGLIPENWGGDTIMVEVSAHQKTGITDLLEMILLVAEVQDLKANPNRHAQGTIVEAQLDKGRGPVATVLVQKGTMHIGDTIIAGTSFGKVRAMINDRGEKVKKAEPSTPVEVLGLSDVPEAGDILNVVDESTARAVAEKRIAKKRTEEMQSAQKVSLDDLFKQIQEGSLKELNIVIKADVQGSIEALRQALMNLVNKEVRVVIVHAGVGAINESDVMLASASNALILGFNVRPDTNARRMAETEKVDVRIYRVIYDAINDVQAAMTGMLAPEFKEVLQGRAEVRQIISVPKTVVAGSYVLEGKITNSSSVRIVRNGIVVHEGTIESLRRFKDDVKEVATGFECGISIEKYRDVKEGDIIEAFTMEQVKQDS